MCLVIIFNCGLYSEINCDNYQTIKKCEIIFAKGEELLEVVDYNQTLEYIKLINVVGKVASQDLGKSFSASRIQTFSKVILDQ